MEFRRVLFRSKKREADNVTKKWLSDNNRETDTLISELQQLEEIGIIDEPEKNEVLQEMYNLPFLENVKDTGISSGLKDLDAIIGAFQNQNSYILGARPSVGKSATMLKFALSAAENGAVPLR